MTQRDQSSGLTEFDAWGPKGHPSRQTRTIISDVGAELRRAQQKFGPIASPHEGYAVILEELDEFWLAVKTKGVTAAEARAELIQVAAMAVRTINDCYEDAP